MPTLVPSIQFGLLGTITPFASPPPTTKSMFDVSLSGPLCGFLLSLLMFVYGLDITRTFVEEGMMYQLNTLPVFPTYLLRASELCGSITEYFLGTGTITQQHQQVLQQYNDNTIDTSLLLIPLHPLAIAGFCGIMSHTLALLPLGNTDGGRISIAMFGRRGSYIVKSFTAVLLCIIGIFGMDPSHIILLYAIYTQLYQRELEIPAYNEVEELDFNRGLMAIITAFVVALTLIPMQ